MALERAGAGGGAWDTNGHRALLISLVLAALAFGLHLNGLGNRFTFDDTYIITDNPAVTGEGGLVRIFSSHYWATVDPRGDLYRPLTIATYWLNYRLAGPSPWSFHLVNLLLQATVAALTFFLFVRLSGSAIAAICASLLFAAHPVHVEAVASVVGRAELLSALFVLGAWLARGRLWLSLALFACGLLSKENAVVLPGLLLVEEITSPGALAGAWARVRAALRGLLPWLGLAALWMAIRLLVVGLLPGSSPGPFSDVPPSHRIFTAVQVFGRYLWLMFYPTELSADYSFNQIPVVSSPLDRGFLAGAAGIAVCLAFAWLIRRRHPAIALGILIFFVALLPAGNILFGIGVVMAERLLYLPSVGLCLAAGSALEWAARAATGRRRRWLPAAACLVAFVPASLLALRSWHRTQDWSDPVTLFEATVASSPESALAHFGLASAYQGQERFEEAEKQYRRSLQIAPDRAETHYNLATLLGRIGQIPEAIGQYRAAIGLDPTHQKALNNLGALYESQGKLEEAQEAYRHAVRLGPGQPGPHFNLGMLLEAGGRFLEAIEQYQEEIRIAPQDVRALNNLGRLLVAEGRSREAIEVLERAVEFSAGAVTPTVNLAAAWLEQGDAARAETLARRVLAGHPGDAAAMRVLEAALKRGAR